MKRHLARAAISGLALLAVVACQPKAAPRTERFAKLPDWSGMWVSAEPIAVIDVDGYPANFDFAKDWKVIGLTGPLNEAARAKLNAAFADPTAVIKFKAPSWGFPLMMESPTPLQFLITPEETVILDFYRDVRHVYTDGRALPKTEDRWPGAWGESVGRWEGDTLVIETVSVKAREVTGLPFPLFSDDAVYVERLRMANPDLIESEVTVTDPATLTSPYVFKVAYKHAPGIDRMFHMPFGDDRTTPGANGLFTIAPPAIPDKD